jgi:transposase-like protein
MIINKNTPKTLYRFIKRSHSAIYDWIHKFIQKIYPDKKRKRITSEFITYETASWVISNYICWHQIAIRLKNKEILGMRISMEISMFISTAHFISYLIIKYDKHYISKEIVVKHGIQAC